MSQACVNRWSREKATDRWRNSGKGLQMAVAIRRIADVLLIVTVAAIWSVSSAKELDQISQAEVVAYLKQETEERLSALNRRIAECSEIRDANKLTVTPEEVSDVFRNSGLSRNDALYAIIFHGGQNMRKCRHKEDADLAYVLNALDRLNLETEFEIRIVLEDAEFSADQLRGLITAGGLDNYRIAIFYGSLPASIIEFMDEKFGKTPFHAVPFASALPG